MKNGEVNTEELPTMTLVFWLNAATQHRHVLSAIEHRKMFERMQFPSWKILENGKIPEKGIYNDLVTNSRIERFNISYETMNSDRHCQILQNKVNFKRPKNQRKFFQQNGAPSYISPEARDLLNHYLLHRWIWRRGYTGLLLDLRTWLWLLSVFLWVALRDNVHELVNNWPWPLTPRSDVLTVALSLNDFWMRYPCKMRIEWKAIPI